MKFLPSLTAYLRAGAALDRSRRPRPSRNEFGVTSLDVCRLDASDIVEATFASLPDGAVGGPLMGSNVLYLPHPLNDTYLVIRDHTGAPGGDLTSVALIQCGCGCEGECDT